MLPSTSCSPVAGARGPSIPTGRSLARRWLPCSRPLASRPPASTSNPGASSSSAQRTSRLSRKPEAVWRRGTLGPAARRCSFSPSPPSAGPGTERPIATLSTTWEWRPRTSRFRPRLWGSASTSWRVSTPRAPGSSSGSPKDSLRWRWRPLASSATPMSCR